MDGAVREVRVTKDQLWEDAQQDPGLIREILLRRRAKRELGEALAQLSTQVSPETAQRIQATENVWRAVDREFGLLSSAEVAQAVGKSGRSYAHERRKAHQLLAVKRGGRYFYPKFQIDDEGPRSIISELAAEAQRLGVREVSVQKRSGEALLTVFFLRGPTRSGALRR